MAASVVCGFLIGLVCALPLGLWVLRHPDADPTRPELLCLAVMLVLALGGGYALDGVRGVVGGGLGVMPLLLLGLNDIRRGHQAAGPG